MTPGNLVARSAEDRRNLVALLRARLPASPDDGQDAWLARSREFRQFLVVDLPLLAQLLDALGGLHPHYLPDKRKMNCHRSARYDRTAVSGTSAELRPMAVNVFDRRRVAPRDLFR